MPSLNEVKMLGGIGSLLTLLWIVPSVGGVLAIIGLVLTLVAVKYASDIFGDPKIFTHMLYAVILGIVGLVIGVAVVASAVFSAFGLGAMMGSMAGSFMASPPTLTPGGVASLLGGVVLGLAALWICFILSAIFLRRSYTELGKRLDVGLFGTGALLYLIGAALTIIIVGLALIFIADILFLVAFFSINTQAMPTPPPPPQPTM